MVETAKTLPNPSAAEKPAAVLAPPAAGAAPPTHGMAPLLIGLVIYTAATAVSRGVPQEAQKRFPFMPLLPLIAIIASGMIAVGIFRLTWRRSPGSSRGWAVTWGILSIAGMLVVTAVIGLAILGGQGNRSSNGGAPPDYAQNPPPGYAPQGGPPQGAPPGAPPPPGYPQQGPPPGYAGPPPSPAPPSGSPPPSTP